MSCSATDRSAPVVAEISRQDVDAIGVVVDHALQTTDLALDTTQPTLHRLFVLCVTDHFASLYPMVRSYTIPPWGTWSTRATLWRPSGCWR